MGRVWIKRVNTRGAALPRCRRSPSWSPCSAAPRRFPGTPPWTAWGLSVFALLIAAIQFRDMVRDLMHGRWGIDILAIMAIIATVVVGEYWASIVIVLMLSGGEALEDYAAGRAKRELTALLARAPQQAHRYEGSTDQAQDVAISQIEVGDTLLVKPSEIVPVDGTLLSDEATLDESSLTGESIPVERRTDEPLLSGSLNGERRIHDAVPLRDRRTANTSASSRWWRRRPRSRAPVVRLADRYAVPFTAVSLLIAGVAWLLSGDPVRFAEVLVVATTVPVADRRARRVHGRHEPSGPRRCHRQERRHARAAGPRPHRRLRQDRHPHPRGPAVSAVQPVGGHLRGRAVRCGGLGGTVFLARAGPVVDRECARGRCAAHRGRRRAGKSPRTA